MRTQADNNGEDQDKNDNPELAGTGQAPEQIRTGSGGIIYGHSTLPGVTACVAAKMIFSCVASARVKCPVI